MCQLGARITRNRTKVEGSAKLRHLRSVYESLGAEKGMLPHRLALSGFWGFSISKTVQIPISDLTDQEAPKRAKKCSLEFGKTYAIICILFLFIDHLHLI